jgi:two-component system, chemotaxis family, CheB/CheR fusion protein
MAVDPKKAETTEKPPRKPRRATKPAAEEQPAEGMIVAGIGASAGGLEALKQLLPNLPVHQRITYVIAQHLDPNHRSMLVSLLARDTAMPVLEAADGMPLEASKIYITPPNSDVTITKGIINLRKPFFAIGPKPSVDILYSSMAEDCGENAIGIILSGTGSDGSHGIRAIKAAGGMTIVQEEATAKYNGMPHASIETDCVDIILPPDKIGLEIARILKFPHDRPLFQEEAPGGGVMGKLFHLVLKRSGADFSLYKPSTIQRRIERRMFANRIDTLELYVALLEKNNRELDALFKDILISVTCFFREPDAFKSLQEHLKKLLATKQEGDTIRVWIPGCATGEEVYTIAILLSELLGEDMHRYNLQIFGTDLDGDVASAARRGIYSEAALEKVAPEIIKKYFIRKGTVFQVIKPIRELIVFAKHDLVKDPPFSHLDLISCRNLLIYFSQALQKRALSLFQFVLNTGGILFLGKSESVGELGDYLTTIDRKHKIFRKISTMKTMPSNFTARLEENKTMPMQVQRSRQKELSLEDLLLRTMAKSFGSPAAIINDRMDLLHLHGDVSTWLRLVPGEVNLNILRMATDGIRVELRALIHKAARENSRVSGKVLASLPKSKDNFVRITAVPVEAEGDRTGLMLVCFERVLQVKVIKETVADQDLSPRIIELEQELTASREHLQTVIEELETANEELQSVNEELQASNEEMQSTNEELETSNEELQSTNEELITVNEELQVKSTELVAANADLENIQENIGFPLLVVDQQLRIKRYNRLATGIFNLLPDDVGQMLTSVRTKVAMPELQEQLQQVLTSGQSFDAEIILEGRFYTIHQVPYLTESGRIMGVVVTFIDNTEIKTAQRLLSERDMTSSLAERTANMASWHWDIATNQFSFSSQMTRLLGDAPENMGSTLMAFIDRVLPEDRDAVLHAFTESVGTLRECRVKHRVRWPDGSIHWVLEAGEVFTGEQGKPLRMAGVMLMLARQEGP